MKNRGVNNSQKNLDNLNDFIIDLQKATKKNIIAL